MVTEQRWKTAQQYERSFWNKAAERIASGAAEQLSWYQWKADQMEIRLKGRFAEGQKKEAKVLEIGSGPIGIVTFLKWGERYTIDPLEDFYKTNPVLSHLRDSTVHYGRGNGENLSFKEGNFSLVILDNILDHAHNAGGVLDEVRRVLSKDGILYLAVNLHTPWGGILHRILSKLLIDPGHPYTFTVKTIREFIRQHGFNIESEAINDYVEARKQDLSSKLLKDKIKGYTGLSEFVYYSVALKQTSIKT